MDQEEPEPIWVFDKHEFTPETVRFLGKSEVCLSASKDTSMRSLSVETGAQIASTKNQQAFACMDVLNKAPFAANKSVVVTADVKSNIMVYTVSDDGLSI